VLGEAALQRTNRAESGRKANQLSGRAGARAANLQDSDGGACDVLYHDLRCGLKSQSARSESAAGAKRPNGKRRRSKSVGLSWPSSKSSS